MSLVRRYTTGWSPARDLLRTQRDLDRMIDGFFGASENGGTGHWAPALELAENEDRVTVRLELPGVKEEDIEISLVENTLTITGEKKREEKIKEEDFVRVERVYGKFQRSVSLPTTVDSQKVEAKLTDGVLEIVLPKHEAVKPRRITLKK